MMKFITFLVLLFINSFLLSSQNSVIDYQESVRLELPETLIKGDYVFFKAYIYSNKSNVNEPTSAVLNVVLKDSSDTIIKTQYHSIRGGIVDSGVLLPKKIAAGSYTIEAYTQWMQNYDHSRKGIASVCIDCSSPYNAKSTNPKIVVEGGVLVHNIPSKLIINASQKITNTRSQLGTIVDENDIYVTAVNGVNGQLGAALFTPLKGVRYFYKSQDGSTYNLPDVVDNGAVINVNNLNEEIFQLRITSNQETTPHNPTLLVYNNGLPFIEKKLSMKNQSLIIELPKNELPKGLIEIYLIDETSKVLNYRPIAIVSNNTNITTEIISQNNDRTQLKIKVINPDSKLSQTPISIAGYKQTATNLNENIIDNYSSRQEFIEDLNLLITNTPEQIDLVKLPVRNTNNYPLQEGLHLIGTAYDLNDRILRNERIEIMASSENGLLIEEALTSDEGILKLENMKLLGNNQIIFRRAAEDVKSRLVKVIPIGKEKATKKREIVASTPAELIKIQEKKEREAIPFNNPKAIDLAEVKLNGENRKKNVKASPSTYGVEALPSRTKFQDADRLVTIPMLVASLPGVTVANVAGLNPVVNIPSTSGAILYVIDGIPLLQGLNARSTFGGPSASSLRPLMNMVNDSDVERIELLVGAEAAIYGSRGAGGVLLVYTRFAGDLEVSRKEGSLSFQGYEPEIPFDSYWNDLSRSKKKKSNLIYWNSKIILDDNGEAIVEVPHYNDDMLKSIKISALGRDGAYISQNVNINN